MADNILTGLWGENLAAEFIINKGYEIRCRNYRFKKSEIDIIAFENNTYIFIEVKYRKNVSFGNPEDFVTPKKISMLIAGAENYIFENNWHGKIRFDIISISGNSIEHFKDAF